MRCPRGVVLSLATNAVLPLRQELARFDVETEFIKFRRTLRRMFMTKKVGMALVLCLVVWQSSTAAKGQTAPPFWVGFGTPSVVPPPAAGVHRAVNLTVTSRPAIRRGTYYDHVDLYTQWPPSDITSPKSVAVASEEYICTRNGCGGPHFVWTTLPNPPNTTANSTPSAVGWQNHRQVFMVGADGNLYTASSDSNVADKSVWSAWTSLGQPPVSGGLCSDPSAALGLSTLDGISPARIDVFARDCHSNLQHISYSYSSNSWGSWEVPAGSPLISGSPVAVSLNGLAKPDGSLHVLVSDLNGLVGEASCGGDCNNNSSSWFYRSTGLQSCAANLSATVSHIVINSWTEVALTWDCAQTITASQLAAESFGSHWQPPASTPATGRPSATDGDKSADVFFTDSNGNVQLRVWKSGWQPQFASTVGTDTFTGSPVAAVGAYPNNNWIVYVFANKNDGSIWYTTIAGNPFSV